MVLAQPYQPHPIEVFSTKEYKQRVVSVFCLEVQNVEVQFYTQENTWRIIPVDVRG